VSSWKKANRVSVIINVEGRLGKDDQDGKVKFKTKWIQSSVVEQKVRRDKIFKVQHGPG